MNKKISSWLSLVSLGLGFVQENYWKTENYQKISSTYANPTKKTPSRIELRKRRKQQRLARKRNRKRK